MNHITYLPGTDIKCECSEEYGPCEQHGTTVVIREGASLHTADELLLLFCEDSALILHDAGTASTPWADDVVWRATSALSNVDEYTHCAWLPDDSAGERLRDELSTLADQLNADLSTMDVPHFSYWNDGYRIVMVAEDCPLLSY
jgi:hypothetical protein